jgi:hypothetical protein
VNGHGFKLNIADPLNWILYHIKLGSIEQDKYNIDFESLQERLKRVYSKISDNWIESIEECDNCHLITDIFGYYYKIPR